jgi:hypothetical protein
VKPQIGSLVVVSDHRLNLDQPLQRKAGQSSQLSNTRQVFAAVFDPSLEASSAFVIN